MTRGNPAWWDSMERFEAYVYVARTRRRFAAIAAEARISSARERRFEMQHAPAIPYDEVFERLICHR